MLHSSATLSAVQTVIIISRLSWILSGFVLCQLLTSSHTDCVLGNKTLYRTNTWHTRFFKWPQNVYKFCIQNTRNYLNYNWTVTTRSMKPMRNHAVDYIKHYDLGSTPCKIHSTVGIWRHFPPKSVHGLTLYWIFVPLSDGGFEPRALFHQCTLVKNGIRGILLEILIWKCTEWMKNSLRRQRFVLQWRETLLNGKRIY